MLSTPSQSLSLPPSLETSPQWEGFGGAAGAGVSRRAVEWEAAAVMGEAGGERVMRRLSSLKAMTVEMSLATCAWAAGVAVVGPQ